MERSRPAARSRAAAFFRLGRALVSIALLSHGDLEAMLRTGRRVPIVSGFQSGFAYPHVPISVRDATRDPFYPRSERNAHPLQDYLKELSIFDVTVSMTQSLQRDDITIC